MSYWSWDPSLSIGIDVIDAQHRRIVDYINELHAAHADNSRDKISDVLTGLVDYTLTHFAFEEDLMENSGYPFIEAHKKVHVAFAENIGKFVEQHEAGHDVTRRLLSTLQVWLTNHIKHDDKDYSTLVKKTLNKNQGWIKKAIGKWFS